MLYIFVCLRPSCSKRADAIKVISGLIHDKNPHVKFATNSEFDQIEGKSDKELAQEGSKYANFYQTEEESKDKTPDNPEEQGQENSKNDS